MTQKTPTWHHDTSFESYEHRDWRNAVDKLLHGADFDKLVSGTLDGIEIQPLYQQLPNAPFYSRGGRPWAIQQTYQSGSLSDTNKNILADLSEGLTSVELQLSGSSNDDALPCYTAEDLEHLLTDVHPQMIELSLTPGSANRLTGALLLAYYYRKKIAAEDVRCALNIDPLGAMAAIGHCPQKALSELAQFASHCDTHFPSASSVCADSSVYHNAGCSQAQELAYLLATTVEYLRALQSLETESAFNQIRYRVALDSDYFLGVAKLRAARELIGQIEKSCGAENSHIVIDAVSSSRSLSTLDSSVNILRTTTQTAAAMAGGANGFNCAPYDQLTEKSAKAQRLARNTQLILTEESGLLNIDDPARGSGYVESLTDDLCSAAWQLFQNIEARGGMHRALEDGSVAEEISAIRLARQDNLSAGKSSMIGVTDYPNLEDKITPVIQTAANAVDNNTSETISLPALIGALSDGKSTLDFQAIDNDEPAIEPIAQFRDSQPFEQLRLRSQKYKDSYGSLPTVTLLTFGTSKDFAARVNFTKNFFAIAGIDTEQADHANNTDTNAELVVLCSTDQQYLDDANSIGSSSKARHLWIAGNNPEVISKLENSGVTESIHLRSDKLGQLRNALDILGAPQ